MTIKTLQHCLDYCLIETREVELTLAWEHENEGPPVLVGFCCRSQAECGSACVNLQWDAAGGRVIPVAQVRGPEALKREKSWTQQLFEAGSVTKS